MIYCAKSACSTNSCGTSCGLTLLCRLKFRLLISEKRTSQSPVTSGQKDGLEKGGRDVFLRRKEKQWYSLVRKKKRRYHFYMGEICSAVENTLWRDFHAGLLIVKWVIGIRSSLSPLAEKRRVSDRQFRLGRALPLVGLNSKLGAG